jgi:hypothetical protein
VHGSLRARDATVLVPESAVADVAGLVVVGEELERGPAAGSAGLEVSSGQVLGWSPVAELWHVGACGGGGGEARLDVPVEGGDGCGVQVAVVDRADDLVALEGRMCCALTFRGPDASRRPRSAARLQTAATSGEPMCGCGRARAGTASPRQRP